MNDVVASRARAQVLGIVASGSSFHMHSNIPLCVHVDEWKASGENEHRTSCDRVCSPSRPTFRLQGPTKRSSVDYFLLTGDSSGTCSRSQTSLCVIREHRFRLRCEQGCRRINSSKNTLAWVQRDVRCLVLLGMGVRNSHISGNLHVSLLIALVHVVLRVSACKLFLLQRAGVPELFPGSPSGC